MKEFRARVIAHAVKLIICWEKLYWPEKHLYVEKPLVLNEAEAEELIRIAKEKNLVLMVGHLLQYLGVIAVLKNWH